MSQLSRLSSLQNLIDRALREDMGAGDITTRGVLPGNPWVRAVLMAKAPGVLAGMPVIEGILRRVDSRIRCRVLGRDGSHVRQGKLLANIDGPVHGVLAAERTLLNILGHLCGVATLTARFVEEVRGLEVEILDTRKTLPGLRALEKYAVVVGGGRNHRADLSDAVLIKTNHLTAMEANVGKKVEIIAEAVARARRASPRKCLEVEVTNLRDVKRALATRADILLLDNMSLPAIRAAVKARQAIRRGAESGVRLEVSGGVTLANVRRIARTGIERISIGQLTHSAPALDLSLKVVR